MSWDVSRGRRRSPASRASSPSRGAISQRSKFPCYAVEPSVSRMIAPRPGGHHQPDDGPVLAQGDPLTDRIRIGPGGPALASRPPDRWRRRRHTRCWCQSRTFSDDVHSLPTMPDAETALNSRVGPLWWSLVAASIRTLCGLPSRLPCVTPVGCRWPRCAPWPRSRCAIRRVSVSTCCCSPSLAEPDCSWPLLVFMVLCPIPSGTRKKELGVRMALGAQPFESPQYGHRAGYGARRRRCSRRALVGRSGSLAS